MEIQDLVDINKQNYSIEEMRRLKNFFIKQINISEKSKQDYKKKFIRVAAYSLYDLNKYIKEKNLNKSSYYCYKAAYQYGMTLILNNALYHYNKLSKEKKRKEARISRLCANEYCKALVKCNCDYRFKHVHDPDSVSLFPGKSTGTKSRKINSKRKSLVGLPKNWQEKVYKNMTIKFREALLVLMLTGCRPDELFKGVSLSISQGFIKADILGSKVTDTKGYKYRSLFFEPNSTFASRKIKDLLGQRGPHVINLGSDDLNNSEKFKARFNKAIKYAAKKNGAKFNDISPYSFRHQKAADLKKEQYEDVNIAFFLGHKSKRMQRHYGFYSQGRGSTGIAYEYATDDLNQTISPQQ